MRIRISLCIGVVLVWVLSNLLVPVSAAQEPVLEVRNGEQLKLWTRSALLADAVEIQIDKDSAYKRRMTYRAVPYAKLMPQVEQHVSVQFVASDGFVANISGKDLAGKGQAYVAIETTEHSWPAVNPDNPHKSASAGPFYLVWLTPEAGNISNEQWPYQVAKISVTLTLSERYPQIVPKSTPSATTAQTSQAKLAMKGLQVYSKHCAVCHTINGGGDASVGPDLNLPFNPTEYFQEAYLRKLIRDPASVRRWKLAVMPGFDRQTIPEDDLQNLLVYLTLMAKQRDPK
nr:cytochrome c [uncultured Undibacterium sp.]